MLVSINDETIIRYLCWGQEVGQEGTPHLQGYVEFRSPRRLNAVKGMFGQRCHLEKARGSGEQNRQYCSKTRPGDTPNEIFAEGGTMSRGPGQRTDLEAIRRLIQDGATEREIAEQHFGSWVRYRGSFQAYRTLLNSPISTAKFDLTTFPREWPRDLDWSRSIILWGDSGIGKTQFALAVLGRCLMVSHIDDLKNFDKTIHEGILFDDMDFKHMPRSAQIHLVDQEHDRSIHVRYGVVNIPKNTKKIFSTNEDRGGCMLVDDVAIRRRIKVHHLIKTY